MPAVDCATDSFQPTSYPVRLRDAPSSPCRAADSVLAFHCGHNANMAVTRGRAALLVLELERLLGVAGLSSHGQNKKLWPTQSWPA